MVTPTITSVRDADKVISILKSYSLSQIEVIINRIRGDLVLSGKSLSPDDIENTLKAEVLGVVPEDDALTSITFGGFLGDSGKAIKSIALRLTGKSSKPYDYLKKYSGFWGSIRKELKRRL